MDTVYLADLAGSTGTFRTCLQKNAVVLSVHPHSFGTALMLKGEKQLDLLCKPLPQGLEPRPPA